VVRALMIFPCFGLVGVSPFRTLFLQFPSALQTFRFSSLGRDSSTRVLFFSPKNSFRSVAVVSVRKLFFSKLFKLQRLISPGVVRLASVKSSFYFSLNRYFPSDVIFRIWRLLV